MKSAFNVWYLDDGSIGGDIDTVCRDLDKLIPPLAARGLEVNPLKCEFLCPKSYTEEQKQTTKDRLHQFIPGAVAVEEVEARILGAPITDRAAERVIIEKIDR